MAHLRIVQLITGKKGQGDSLQILPGTYKSDREATAAIKKSGDYLFLEVHTIKVDPSTQKDDHGDENDDNNKEA